MSHNLDIDRNLSKSDFYKTLFIQLEAILEGETDTICRMSIIACALAETKRFFWCGFYRVIGEELVLGPFAGPLACMRIKRGHGVCGSAWNANKSFLVPDVNQFPGHIACSTLSKSEIVIPIHNRVSGAVIAVLDVDHTELGGLDDFDLAGLERIAALAVV